MSARTIALIGDPIAGSLSPAIQNAAFRELGLPLAYVLHPVARGALADAFPGLRGRYAGLNVTTPHKKAALGLVDSVGAAAHACGSVNTIAFGTAGAHGDSTDGAGFLRALRRAAPGRAFRRALIVGAGGAARAVAASLVAEGTPVAVWSRDPAAAAAVAGAIPGVSVLRAQGASGGLHAVDLLVSAIPASAWAGGADPLPAGLELRGASLTVFDLVYRPRRTPLLERAAAAGCATVEGIEMLIEQGALSLTMWTGRAAPLEVMRAAAYEALGAAAVSA